MISAPDRIKSLDSIRGIAALIVVLSHFKHMVRNANELAGLDWDSWFLVWPIRLLWGGDEALFSFFVLSGFVLGLPFVQHRGSRWVPFIRRRMLRLYPAYAVVLLLSLLIASLVRHMQVDQLDFILDGYPKMDWSMARLLGHAFLLIDVNDANPPLWALVQAMRVALIYPFLFVLIRYLGAILSLFLSVLLSLMTVVVSGVIAFPSGWEVVGHSVLKTTYFLFFFVLGTNLAIHRMELLRRLTGPWRTGRLALCVIGLGLMGLKVYLPYLMGPLAVGAGFAIILMVTQATPWMEEAMQAKPLRFLGRISYSLFLVHLPVTYAIAHLLYAYLPFGAVLAMNVGAAIVAAWFFWRLIEQPTLRWARQAELTAVPPRARAAET